MVLKFCHKRIGSYLKGKRLDAGLTQSQVSTHLGLASPQFVSNIERGLCSPPLCALAKMASIYDLDLNELILLIMKEQEKYMRKYLRR